MTGRGRWLRLGITTAVGLGLGEIGGQPMAGAAAALLALNVWYVWQHERLLQWLGEARRGRSPDPKLLHSIWSDHSAEVEAFETRFARERLRLQAVVSRVQEMTAALEDSVILADRIGNIEWWNPAAQAVFNLREADFGQRLTNLIRHPSFVNYFESGEYGQPLDLTFWRRETHLEFRIHSFGGGERLVIVRDTTRLFRLERMRKDFVANVSHELRTPLTVIQGYVETLQDLPGQPPTSRRALAEVEVQCRRMGQLVMDLITLARLETDEKEPFTEPVPLAPLLEGVLADARALSSSAGQTLELHCPEEIALIGSERELQSAFTNLAVNAVSYSGANASIRIVAKLEAEGASVCVEDNGAGIDPKHLPRLTERFYRVDPARSAAAGGTGLGLAIVKHILLRHNGWLTIHSELGSGSSFCCHFPLSRVQVEPQQEP